MVSLFRKPARRIPIHPAAPALLVLWALAAPCPASAEPGKVEPGKAFAPIPDATLALMRARGTTAAAPVLFRAYKKESEIEIWKRAAGGRFVHVKTFPICRWSGQLGPKRKTGDRQTPEGFYTVPQRQMNPNSSYYLSFDVGYPNAYDRAQGSTGSAVMVHGVCSSMGCFAMTDRVVGEIYAIAREAFAGGQGAFQFQSFPFRMNAANMARHRTDPNIAFWRQLKEGADRFDATGEEPVVGVSAGRYVFSPFRDPAKEALAAAYRSTEEARIAALVEEGSAAVRTTYSDGAQHPFWAALAAKGTPLGDVSRPEALAYAGQEVVVIAARPRPIPVAEAVWSRWVRPDSVLSRTRMAGFVPSYERAGPVFAPLVTTHAETRHAQTAYGQTGYAQTRYGQTWPTLVALSLSGVLPPPAGLAPPAIGPVAQR